MSEHFDAWWLPDAPSGLTFESVQAGGVQCRYPAPTPALIDATLQSLRDAGRAIGERPVAEIVAAVDAAAGRLLDPEDPIRGDAERLLQAASGYSQAMATLVIERMAADWRAGPTRRLLRAELDDAAALDGFAPAGDGRRVRAYGPRLTFHVFAGNVPGVAVTSLVRALLVKTPSLGKLASGQPILPVLFARALDSVDPALARALAITYWPGGSTEAEQPLLEAADAVVVYGGADAVSSIRSMAPDHPRLLTHGPRFSVGLIDHEALTEDPILPDRVARAIATFDQQGCVSPQAIWVEDPAGDNADRFAEAVADSFRRLETELPRGRITPPEAALIQQERGAAELRSHDGSARVFASDGTGWTVILDRNSTFRPSCLNRFVRIHPVATLAEVPHVLAPVGHQLQSVAIAAPPDRRTAVAHDLARIGATRITSFDSIPWPPPEWHHDGRGPLSELLRWVDLET